MPGAFDIIGDDVVVSSSVSVKFNFVITKDYKIAFLSPSQSEV